jgi:hypothetical protein
MAAGSIIVDLLMRTGSFETDTARAAKAAEKRAKEIQASFERAGTIIGTAIVAGVGAATYAFDQLVKQAGNFKDLEEITGATAEGIASLAVAAATAGVGIEDIATSMNRLTKNLSGVDDESKAAGAALKALGIPIEDFKRLDPVAQIDALTKAFGGFKDGPVKSAAAIALLGKSGAEMLKVFKAIEEQGGRQTILTQQQSELADAYADQQAKATAELRLYAQAAATEALPAINDIIGAAKDFIGELVGVDQATGQLGKSTAVRDFADAAADAFAFIIDAGRGVVTVFQTVGLSYGATAAAIAALARGDVAQAKQIAVEGRADIEKILNAESFADRLAKQRANRAANPIEPKASDTRPQLDFRGATSAPKKAKTDTNDAEKLLKQLNDQYVATIELTNVEKALIAIRSDGFKGLTPEYERLILEQAAVLDADKALERQFKATQEALDESVEIERKFAEAGIEAFEATRTPLEKLNAELERLNVLQQKGVIDWDTYVRAVSKAQDAFTETGKTGKDTVDDLNVFVKRGAENIQDALGDTFYNAMKGNFKGIGDLFADLILRLLAQAQAAQLAKALFGDMVGGQGSGLVGSFVSAIGGAVSGFFGGSSVPVADGSGSTGDFARFDRQSFQARAAGGPVSGGTTYLVGERGPELFKPQTTGRILPNSALEPGQQSTRVEVHNYGSERARVEESGSGGSRLIKVLIGEMAKDVKNGGLLGQSIAGTFGGNPAAGITRR